MNANGEYKSQNGRMMLHTRLNSAASDYGVFRVMMLWCKRKESLPFRTNRSLTAEAMEAAFVLMFHRQCE